MPKRPLKQEFQVSDIIATLVAGHLYYRADLNYPQSHSDMQGAVEGLLLKYDVKLRPLPREREELYEPNSTCVMCGKESHHKFGDIPFCGNIHAQQYARRIIESCPVT